MYEQFRPSDDVFVDREEFLEWMKKALARCKTENVVLHLKGIGGIGKSSLVNHWINTHEKAIRLDCYQYTDFYQRLNILAKGAVLHGIKLHRFDILWQIRQRFVEGVEPVKEEGRQWAKEVVMAIPFIGSLATIGSAIGAVGAKITPKLKGKYSTVGRWLQEQLGKNHIERLLEILWKEPRRAEFLYLSAFLEDINSRDDGNPVLFLLDHFEHVDEMKTQWRFGKKRISESKLWTIFLSSLSNCVGVLASRKPATKTDDIQIEETELLELDRDSCIEMLELQDVADKELQERIVSVSGGNPFVIDAICDMVNTSEVSLLDIENLRADNLAEVRLRVWRRLFSQAEGLQSLINRAGIVPYFDERIMCIIAPEMTPDSWDRLRRLSFVREREDGSFVLHELAQDLVKAELGGKLKSLALKIGQLLEEASEEQDDFKLLGLSISVQGLHSPKAAIEKVEEIASNQSWRFQFLSAIEMLGSVKFDSVREQMIISLHKAWHLTFLDRVAEAEHLLKEALEVLLVLTEEDPNPNLIYLLGCYEIYGVLLHRTRQPVEAEAMFERAFAISKDIDPSIDDNYHNLMELCWWYGSFSRDMHHLDKAIELYHQALYLLKFGNDPDLIRHERALSLYNLGYALLMVGKPDEAEELCKEAIEISTQDVNRLNGHSCLGEIYWRTSRLDEAKENFKESLNIVQEISMREEGVHQVKPFGNLRHYALTLKLSGNYTEAEAYYMEDLEISRGSVDEFPEVYLPALSMVLNDFAVFYHEMNRYSEAGEFYREAIETYENLSKGWPDRYRKHLAWTLNNYSILLRETGQEDEAQRFLLKALDIGRNFARRFPENIFHSHLMGLVLNNLGVLYSKLKENVEAEKTLREALEIRQALVKKTPDIFLANEATTLNNLGVVLANTERQSEALEVCLQALEAYRRLAEVSPNMHNARLGSVLNNIGNIYRLSNDDTKAGNYHQESVEIFDKLALKAPSVYKRHLVIALSNHFLYHRERGELEASEIINVRLNELGLDALPAKCEWIDIEETEVDAF